LRSVSGNIGAVELYRCVKQLDAQLKKERTLSPSLALLIRSLKSEIAITISAIHDWVKDTERNAEAESEIRSISAMSRSVMSTQMASLITMLEEGDMDAREVARQFIDGARDIGVDAELETLANAMEDFAFDRAEKIVRIISEKLKLEV
jgi:hypothetical protein